MPPFAVFRCDFRRILIFIEHNPQFILLLRNNKSHSVQIHVAHFTRFCRLLTCSVTVTWWHHSYWFLPYITEFQLLIAFFSIVVWCLLILFGIPPSFAIACVLCANTNRTRSSADADKPARRLQRSAKVTKHSTIPYARYSFLLVCNSNFVFKTRRFPDIWLRKKCRNLEIRVRGHSRSLRNGTIR